MVYVKKVWKEFSVKELTDIAKSCSSKEEFRTKYKEQYFYCLKRKLDKEILSLIPHKKKWTKETLIEDAKKYDKISDWMSGNISAYNTALKTDYYDECISHMERGVFGPIKKWDYNKIKKIYSKYDNIIDSIRLLILFSGFWKCHGCIRSKWCSTDYRKLANKRGFYARCDDF